MPRPTPPLNFLFHVDDERIRRLIQQVWRRLPACDRAVLRELVLEVQLAPDHELYAGSAGPCDPYMPEGNAGQIATTSEPAIVMLYGLTEMPNAPALWVIAHEFAHIVLRHHQLSTVCAYLDGFDNYTDADLEALKAVHEDAADLLAFTWGFAAELTAILAIWPEARRARWYAELQYVEAPDAEQDPD